MPPGYHLGCKTKSADRLPHCEISIGADSGSGLAALALVLAHIHDRFFPAMLAEQGEIRQGRRRQDLDLRRVPALRANDLISLQVYLITSPIFVQLFCKKSFLLP